MSLAELLNEFMDDASPFIMVKDRTYVFRDIEHKCNMCCLSVHGDPFEIFFEQGSNKLSKLVLRTSYSNQEISSVWLSKANELFTLVREYNRKLRELEI